MTKEKDKYNFRYIISTLGKSIRQYKKISIISMILIGLEGLFENTIPLIMTAMINELKDKQQSITNQELWTLIAIYVPILIVLAMLAFVCAVSAAKTSAKAAIGFTANLRQDIFYKTQQFTFENIDHFSKASLVTRQTTDINNISMAYMMIIRIGVLSPVNFIYSLIASIIVGASLSWIFAITIPLLAVGIMGTILAAMKIFNIAFPLFDELNKDVQENVRGIRTIKTYTREEFEKKKFAKSSENITKLMVKGEIYAGLFNPVATLVFQLSMILFISIGALAYMDSNLSIGGYSALMNYSINVLVSLLMLSSIFVLVSMSFASGKRICQIMDEKPTIVNSENPIKEIPNGSIDFNHVFFKYSLDADEYVLNDIDIHIPSGSTIGIIGGTGSAKSSVVNLIPRFYDATKGEILVGGINVKDYDISSLRDNVSMVLQKNILFSGTLRENMLWGREGATDEEIQEALKIAQASEFADALPGGFDYMVEQGGTNFSGGQKQRLCIARALLKPAKILIFDDSTSAVDTKTDANIREALKNSYPEVTKIIIAQRISSVLSADKIIVMDNGKITGIGTAKELFETNAIFQEVCRLQKVTKEQIELWKREN